MNAEVYFSKLTDNASSEEQAEKSAKIFEEAEARNIIAPGDFTAVKVHVGEKNNTTHLSPEIARTAVQMIKENEGQPFLVETSTLYKGERENAIKHLMHAHRHGFGIEKVGAPFIMADGLSGNTEHEVIINAELNKTVRIAREIAAADSMVVLSHATGHVLTAIGATIKNLGMGLASRKGKMKQHSSIKPQIKPDKCTLCKKCQLWCPEGIIEEGEDSMVIDTKKCIGCGECLAVCRFGAVKYNFGRESKIVQKEMAEYAYGVTLGKEGKCFYMNVLVDMTKDCDCLSKKQSKMVPDIGILGSYSPVAVDKATLDLTAEYYKKDLGRAAFDLDASLQIDHAEKIGMGGQRYKLVEV